ncbi:MAG: cyclohexanecarboxylate-CoA ligase [Actinomycetota bacterium]|jgi:cyclohexanecarboxylate-CoA ligase
MRTSFVPARAKEYRRAGGPWDVPPLDAVLARSTPAAVLVEGKVRLSGRELEQRVAELAGGLRAAGVKRRDVVAWQLPNVIEAAMLYRACWRLGAVAAPVHHQAGSTEVDGMLSAVDPALFLADRNDVRRLGEDAEVVKAVPAAVQPSDFAVVLFTSGSTGQPKAVLHTHRGLAYKARLMARAHGLHRGDVVLMPAPLAHISGLLNGVLLPGAAGMRSVLMPKWDPSAALDLIETERVSFMIGPPTFFVGLMGASDFAPARVESLRLVSSGGAGVSPGFVTEASTLLGCRVKRTYGSTEAPTITTSTPTDTKERARQTDGRPVGEAEVRLGTDDELLVRGPELFAGYADVEQTKHVVERGGWFRTGDKATIDRDGWVTIVGRIKDIVIRGGENISVAEVEAVLESHPAVRQAVAVGVPDARLGERLVAFVVTSKAFDLAACRDWFADQGVARYKTPERIVVLDSLPTLAAGKPDRTALKEIAASGRKSSL